MRGLKVLPFFHSYVFFQSAWILIEPRLHNSNIPGVAFALKKIMYDFLCYQTRFNLKLLIDYHADMLFYLLQRLVNMSFYRFG